MWSKAPEKLNLDFSNTVIEYSESERCGAAAEWTASLLT